MQPEIRAQKFNFISSTCYHTQKVKQGTLQKKINKTTPVSLTLLGCPKIVQWPHHQCFTHSLFTCSLTNPPPIILKLFPDTGLCSLYQIPQAQTQIKTLLLKISTPVSLFPSFLVVSRPISYTPSNDPAKLYNI